jgi:hypothetical protein
VVLLQWDKPSAVAVAGEKAFQIPKDAADERRLSGRKGEMPAGFGAEPGVNGQGFKGKE